MGDFTNLLHKVRLLIIWALWSIAWFLMGIGHILDDVRWMVWGVFVGLGATVVVLWAALEDGLQRERLSREEMALAAVRARQRLEGPRALE